MGRHVLRPAFAVLLVATLALSVSAQGVGIPGIWEDAGPGKPCGNGEVPLFSALGTLNDNPGVAAWHPLMVFDGTVSSQN